MKKKILSIVLVSVMLLAMIPGLALSANPEINTLMDYKNYRTVVTSDTLLVDGELDEIYKNSQKITGDYWLGTKSNVDFVAYTAVTLRGLYVWAEIKDHTLDKSVDIAASSADRFQLYIKMSDGIDLSWGWYETDYNGNTTVHSIMSGDDIEGNYENNWDCVYSTKELCDSEVSTVKLADGSGWRSEIFIPFSVELLNFTNYDLSVGVQVNNGVRGDADYGICYDRAQIVDAWYRYDCYKPFMLVREVDRGSSGSPNYIFTMEDIYRMDDVPIQGDIVNNAVYASGGFSIDGKKDSKYSEHAKIPLVVWHTYYSNSKPIATPIATLGDVYVAFDNENLYVYYEKYDENYYTETVLTTNYYFDDGENVTAGGMNSYFEYSSIGAWGSTISDGNGNKNPYGWPEDSTPINSNQITVARNKNTAQNIYSIEYKMPLPDGIKAKLAKNEDVSMKISFNTGGYNSSKVQTMIVGSHPRANSFYEYKKYGDIFTDPNNNGTSLLLSKTFTDEKPGAIHGASLSLGPDITVNYYATIGSADVNNAYMRFTRNGKEYIAYPRRIAGSSQYKFAFTGIAPQNMRDNIKAELVVGKEVVATYDNYSVRQNCITLLENEEYRSNVKMNNLVKALLNYGAAAQEYVNYDTKNLANQDYKVILYTPEKSDSVRSVGGKISDDIYMTAMGVYFNNDNRIYVKFYAKSLDGVTVTMNGVKASIEVSNAAKNEYIAYSDSIPVTQFGILYRIVLSDGDGSQVAKYSVNSYAYAKLTSANEAMVELAKATYTYGDAAKKYAGIGDTVYTVMSYNDADNHAPYSNNYGNVMKIINDCDPDLVGMQEIQKDHVMNCYLATNFKDEGDNCFKGENGAYAGVFYISTPGEPKREDYPDTEEGQKLFDQKYNCYKAEGSSGDMILYRKDKFEIVKDNNGEEVKGRLWLSDTPDVPSILPDTEYTQCVMYVLLRDKQTEKEILYINLHASYKEANKRQIEILMDLFEKEGGSEYVQHAGLDMTSYRKIYTADWNFSRYSSGYNVMNANGYVTTESLLDNVYKPTTTVNGAFIDFCFVNGNEFKTLKYKVINDHPLSLYTSDHYPIYSKIAWVEEYENVLLEEDIKVFPETPPYHNGDNFFYTEDDNKGFLYEE